jgi:hypothetical protein
LIHYHEQLILVNGVECGCEINHEQVYVFAEDFGIFQCIDEHFKGLGGAPLWSEAPLVDAEQASPFCVVN